MLVGSKDLLLNLLSKAQGMTALRWSFNSTAWTPTEDDLSTMSSLIQPEEKTRIARFVYMRDAKSSLVGRLLLRKCIRLQTSVPNHLIKLGRDEHNKPILLEEEDLRDNNGDNDNPLLDLKKLNFNISHQGNYVVLASHPSATSVGIDVMNIERPGSVAKDVDEYFRLMKRQFTENEWAQIKGLNTDIPDKKKMTNFTRFWTLKEAYVKAIGVGIVMDLRTIDFSTKTDLDYSAKRLLASDTSVKVSGCSETFWKFEERFLDKSHIVTVAKSIEEKEEEDPPEFTPISLDFLLKDMSPLAPQDPEWVGQFLKKRLK